VESVVQLLTGTQHAKGYADIAFQPSLTFTERVFNVG
jgi:hypothetical protein